MLEAELNRIARTGTASVGLAVTNLKDPSVPTVTLSKGVRFPMASTYKVPLAVSVLRLVDGGALSLDEVVELGVQHVRPGTGVLTAKLLDLPEASQTISCTVYDLLELALNDSDNTATDLLFERVGGPAVVNEQMRGLGLQSMLISRTCLGHLAARCGIRAPIPSPAEAAQGMVEFVATLEGRMEVQPLSTFAAADAAYDADPKDQTTPEDMTELLSLIWRREAGISEESTQVLLSIMAACRTGQRRIPGSLPKYVRSGAAAAGAAAKSTDAILMHKTGSLGGRANDVGWIVLPDGAGVLALSIYTKGPPTAEQKTTGALYAERERTIADLARTCYDFYLFSRT